MRLRSISKFIIVCLAVILISGSAAGCGPKTSNPPGQTAPNEKSKDYTYDNNRTNHNNFGIIAEDLDYIYYKNISDTSALYRLDKKTNEKLKLADIDKSIIAYLSVWDDKVYYVAVQNTPPTPRPTQTGQADDNTPRTALYCVGKDGTGKTKLIDNVFECFVANGDVYYVSLGTSTATAMQNIYKYSLVSGTTETLIEGMITNINMNNAGDKLYYIKRNVTPVTTGGARVSSSTDVIEYDMIKKEEKVVLLTPVASPSPSATAGKSVSASVSPSAGKFTPVIPNATSGFGVTAPPSGGSSASRNVNFLNYYDGSLYYLENKVIKKYNLATGEIAPVSKTSTPITGNVSALAVSRLGIFYVINQSKQWTLYNAAEEGPVSVTSVSITDGTLFLALASDYILLINDFGNTNAGFIKAFTLKGEEVALGF